MTIQDKIVNYCQGSGIKVKFKPVNSGFLLGVCRIDTGCRFTIDPNIDWNNVNDVSLILHELGHLLSVPKEQRPLLTSRLKGIDKKYICEYAARLVSYNLCLKLNVPLDYCLGIFGASPKVPDRDHSIASFYLHALKWYENDRWEYRKEAIMGC
jgi:hypothetical protein